MRPAVFFRLRLSLQTTAALPTPILTLNLAQRPESSQLPLLPYNVQTIAHITDKLFIVSWPQNANLAL
jgi:hypothetical protein